MNEFPHNNGRRHDTDERKNYAELNLTLDGRVWTAIKNNKKFIALCLLFGLNLINGVSVRDLTVMNRKEIGALQDKVKDYDALQTKVAMCEEIQKKQIELLPLVERLTQLLKTNRPSFRNPQARRDFEDVTTRILQIKPIGQGNDIYANPGLPSPKDFTHRTGERNE